MARSRKSSQLAAKQRSCMVQQQHQAGNVAIAIATALPMAAQQLHQIGLIGSNPPAVTGAGDASESMDFVDVPLNDSALLSWSTTTALSEKRASF